MWASWENPVVVICDGHGSHISLPVLDFCCENSIHLVLRLQHTLHVTQVEDIANLGTCKELLRIIKNSEMLTDKVLSSVRAQPVLGKKMVLLYVKLDNADLMACVKGAWEAVFAHCKCLLGSGLGWS